MTPRTLHSSTPPERKTKMLFLVSHGLQSPLSAIRWGCGRLQRTGKLSTEQRKLLDGIKAEGRLLSRMFDWLLLQAKVGDGVHVPNIQDISLHDVLVSCGELPLLHPLKLRLDCPKDLQIRADRILLEAALQALLLALSVGSGITTLHVTVKTVAGHAVISLDATLTLVLLDEEQTGKPDHRIAGGVSGFLLAVSSSFIAALGGTIDHDTGANTISNLRLRLPLRPPARRGTADTHQ